MLKMLIRMDEKKITEEKTYKLESVYQTLDRLFAKYGLLRMEDTSAPRVYGTVGMRMISRILGSFQIYYPISHGL